MPFSLEDKHTIKVLRQQKLYGATQILRMFRNKNWTLSGVKTVLSKTDATGSVELCSGSGRPRTARRPDTISDVQDPVLSGSEPRRLRGVGEPTGACVYKHQRITGVEELPAPQGGMGPSRPGSD